MKSLEMEVQLMISEEQMREFDAFVFKMSKWLDNASFEQGGKSFLGNIQQISSWGKFQASSAMRDKFWALAVRNEMGEIEGSALVVKQKLPRGRCWLYVPRGPVLDFGSARTEKIMELLLEKIKELGKQEKAVFLRIDPAIWKTNDQSWLGINQLLRKYSFRQAHAHYQPENTLMLDLAMSEEEILAQMKPKGRYNIKLAEKKGVKVVEIMSGKDSGEWTVERGISEYYRLLQETTLRDGFSGHNQKYYQNMLEILGAEHCRLYLAELEGEIIAGMIVTFLGGTGMYYFGASGNRHRNVMAPYLLQWRAIREAKFKGAKWYDLMGVAPVGAKNNHPWVGVTEFKEKFGGQRVDYLPAQELILDWPIFWLMRSVKFLKKMLRKRT